MRSLPPSFDKTKDKKEKKEDGKYKREWGV
jgi:hypothetical protein